jgi:hypothetical protein
MKRTTIWLEDRDREAMRRIRERWGLGTDSDAIRVAVRTLAHSRLDVVPEQALDELKRT